MRWLANTLTCFLCRVVLTPVSRTYVLHRERTKMRGAYLLVANHISHFDPPILSIANRRKIDWMAMGEMFENRLVAAWLNAVDAFAVDRFRADRAAVRTALARLARGRVVGMFPEGGIRDGAHSILEGAPMKTGVAALAQLSGAPVVPCVVVGSDRLYAPSSWWPIRKVALWVAYGEPLYCPEGGKAVRAEFEAKVADALRTLYRELQTTFGLTTDDLPQPPMRRKGRL